MDHRKPSRAPLFTAQRPLLLDLGIVLATLLSFAPAAHSRLQPYYVLEGQAFGQVKPKILIALDNSNSMAVPMNYQPNSGLAQIPWNEAEAADPNTESRISTARRAIARVVTDASSHTDFAFMTFHQKAARTTVPGKCPYAGAGGDRRFFWADRYALNQSWNTSWDRPIEHYAGYTGTWLMCQNGAEGSGRPWPYLRWDELGEGSAIAANNQTAAVPASPLISTVQADMKHPNNAHRRVQWFPRFMGVRTQLNVQTDPDRSILYGTIGDWGSTNAARDANVWQQDFYYWPYVDGFPGYSVWFGRSNDPGYTPTFSVDMIAGVILGEGVRRGRLYAPFYLDFTGTGSAANLQGPRSPQEALDTVLGHTGPMWMGGVEPHVNGTPWASTVGTIPGSPPAVFDNRHYTSHTSVATYFHMIRNMPEEACVPLSMVIVTDGLPVPYATEGGTVLFTRLSALREQLGAKVFVIGTFAIGQDDEEELNEMACAGAGGCVGAGACSSPCSGVPEGNWDTCADPLDHTRSCAYLAADVDALVDALERIVALRASGNLSSGTGTAVNDVGEFSDDLDRGERFQTAITAFTGYPGWRGHVKRAACTDKVGASLAPWCQPPANPPSVGPTFGPCAPGWTWNSAGCLKSTKWFNRALYTSDEQNRLVRIVDPATRLSTTGFTGLIGRISGPWPRGGDISPFPTNDFARFLHGFGAPQGWKMPGVANSAPTVVRRVAKPQPNQTPSLPIRDPHCAGRVPSANPLPQALEEFAEDAWDPQNYIPTPQPHPEYQDAVLVGDDLGFVHAFQLQSGNELWGYIPPFLLESAFAQYQHGAAAMGQPSRISDHVYGVAATLNHGLVWDPAASRMRHLGIFGVGKGGEEFVALDLSHMSPVASPAGRPSCGGDALGSCPFEVLWTSEDAALAAAYDARNAETWARPALTYRVPNDNASNMPIPYLLFGGGYNEKAPGNPSNPRGAYVMLADALTGAIVESAVAWPGAPHLRYEQDYGLVGDLAVATNCKSRMWGEMQEVYFADTLGRLFRWDQGHFGTGRAHEADSAALWSAQTWAPPLASFRACTGTGDTCTVGSGAAKREAFTLPMAVSGIDRIDDFATGPRSTPAPDKDVFLIAMASGSPYDDAIDGGAFGADFHSSIYLLVDNHTSDPWRGLAVPGGAPKVDPNNPAVYPSYFRAALSDIERTRVYRPYPGAAWFTEVANFSKLARPVRAPRILVRAVADQNGAIIDEVEAFEITFFVYEPARVRCNSVFYEAATDTWHRDMGSTYEVTFRVLGGDSGINLRDGVAVPGALPPGYAPELTLVSVKQNREGDCNDGNCAPRVGAPGPRPCTIDNAADIGLRNTRNISVFQSQSAGFTPTE